MFDGTVILQYRQKRAQDSRHEDKQKLYEHVKKYGSKT